MRFPESAEHLGEQPQVFEERAADDNDVMQIYEDVGLEFGSEHDIEESLEGGRVQAEGHDFELEEPLTGHGERGDGAAFRSEGYLPVPALQI